MKQPSFWKSGDPLAALKLNECPQAIRDLMGMMGHGSGGNKAGRGVLGIIAVKGPKNEADFSDARYWVSIASTNSNTSAGGAVESLPSISRSIKSESSQEEVVVCATNLAELQGGSHRLVHGAYVWLMPVWGSTGSPDQPGSVRWVFGEAPEDFVGWCEITASSQIGSNMQWEYTVKTKLKTGTGHAGWTDHVTGMTAYNSMEYGNGATGLMGNGVTLNGSGLVEGTGYTLGAVPSGKGLHRLYAATWLSGGIVISELWFSAPNPLSGDCTA